ncbi:Ankyrin repeat [Sesbania bispinosa]|nr:Ankyrin repeat [Sesbania bispinosa]
MVASIDIQLVLFVIIHCIYFKLALFTLLFYALHILLILLEALNHGFYDIRLHLAAFAGQAEVVSYLCKHKADVGASAMDDMAAMHFAAQKGHLEVVRALLSAGASVKAFTRKGMTSLHYAAQGSHLELVKYLAKKGASLTAKTRAGKTPLDLATNEEVHSFLEEFERSAKNGELKDKEKAEESDPNQS